MRRRGSIALTLATLAAATLSGAAEARSVTYHGKTREGVSIRLIERAGKVRIIKTGLPVVCLSTNRVGKSQSGGDPLHIRGNFPIGRAYRTSGVWQTALWWKEVTVNISTDFRRTRGGLTGTVGETFQFMVPTYPMPLTINYACRGVTTFTARRV